MLHDQILQYGVTVVLVPWHTEHIILMSACA